MSIKSDIEELIEGEVKDDTESIAINSEDTSLFHIEPECVAYPKHVKDLQTLVKYATKSNGACTLTARSAGTDMSGGPLTNSVVVSFTEHFNKIISTDAKQATAQPGVFYRDFEVETLKHGVLLPCYTSSRELNTLGGIVANNSAGEKSLTYGKAEKWTQALKVVLSDGNEYEFKKLSRAEFEAKKNQNNFEGNVYRQIEKIILDNYQAIKEAKPTVAKNSAGYSIWNVWDETTDTFDLTQLIIGSQGTLGLVSEITFNLLAPKQHARMLVMFLRKRHMKVLGDMVNTVLKEKPESFESYDDKTFGIMLRILPKLLKKLGGNPFKLLLDFLPEAKMILTGGIPKLVLMAEFVGDSDAEVEEAAKKAQSEILKKYKVSTRVTKSKKEGEKFWTIRRESFKLLRENVRGKHTAPFIDDISVRPDMLPEFLPKLYAIMAEYDLIFTIAGHIGDGNFHIIPLMDFTRPDFKKIIEELSNKVYTLVVEYEGSITGEHNDGLIRTPFLSKMFNEQIIGVFTSIKDVFDKDRIFNPHKKVDPDFNLMMASIKKTNPV